MNETFALQDPANAQEFLQTFPTAVRRKGTNLTRKGYVRGITADAPGSLYTVEVTDPIEAGVCTVELEYDADLDGWSGNCSCPAELDCPHIYAAMNALLAENSTATVRNLSAGVARGVAGVAKGTGKSAPAADLARLLTDAVGRQLKPDEAKFVRKIQSAYARCRNTRQITYWDFEEMGMRLGGYGWEGLQIWPAFPENEHQFWLYIAYAALQRKAPIPAFMEPVTNFALVEDRMAQWRRSKEIERWTQALGQLQLAGGSPAASSGHVTTELRVLIDETEAVLQWRRPGRVEFETIKPQQLSRLANQNYQESLSLSTESELLWRLVESRYYYGAPAHFRYQDAEACRILGRLLRAKLLEDRMVNLNGDPLLRPPEPLRWQLTPAENDDDDYRFRLIQADGSKLARICCVLPGTPNLYLTPRAVFLGPPPHDGMLDPLTETRIPAPAIERTGGVTLLQNLGLEMPPRIRERVRSLPFQVVIHCQLQPIYHGSKTEDCAIRVLAEASDGHQQAWIGNGWTGTQPGRFVKTTKGAPDITLYDWAALHPVPSLLEPLDLKPNPYGNGGMLMRVTKKFPDTFATWLKTVPAHINVQLAGDLASFASADVAGRVTLEVSETAIDWFDLRVVLNVTDTTLTPEETKLLLNAKGGYVRLEGKGWRRLQYDLSDDENERLAKLGLNARELTSEPQRLHALQLGDDAAKKFLPEEQVAHIQRRVGEIKARVAPALPPGVTAQLRPYQLEGFHFLAYLSTNRFGGILADDMGLGKTVQALAWMTWLRQQTAAANTDPAAKPAPGLVVCPKSVMDNWRAEAERFTPEMRVKVWPASEITDLKERVTEADLHVLNYNQLRLLGEGLAPVRWGPVILDEGQYIKNPSSQTAQIARSLQTEHRLVLSGTPIENRLLDLWSLMAFAMPGVLGSRAQFARLYDAKGDPFARRRLSARVRPFLLRRTKAQVAKDLPDRIEEDLFCEIEGEQKTLYRAELKRAQQLLLRVKTQKELASQHFHFLTSLLRLRQICCHPRLVNDQTQASGAKMEALLEQLEPIMEEGNKVLVFSQFVTLLDLLKPALEARNWPVFYLAGQTENRGELVQQFQTAPGAGIFLISLKAGGFGLNLTAASYVVLFDPWWNPAVENQAIDRTHRIGQVNKVIAYRLLIKDSIEEKIRALQKQKSALAQDVLGEEKFSQSLTLEDLHFLLSD